MVKHWTSDSYNDQTKTYVVYSSTTGEVLFNGKVKSRSMRNAILKAVRKAEDQAFESAKQRVISMLASH